MQTILLTRASQHVQILTSAFGRSLLSALGSRRSQGQCSRASFWSARSALLSRTGAEACVVTARALVGLWSVPDDDWALPGQSSDCLRQRADIQNIQLKYREYDPYHTVTYSNTYSSKAMAYEYV